MHTSSYRVKNCLSLATEKWLSGVKKLKLLSKQCKRKLASPYQVINGNIGTSPKDLLLSMLSMIYLPSKDVGLACMYWEPLYFFMIV